MDRQRQEMVLRRLLRCAPEHDPDHAEQAVAALADGNLIPLMFMYHVPRADALTLLHHAWSRPPWSTGLSGEAQQLVDMEAIHGAYSAVSAYLDRIGIP